MEESLVRSIAASSSDETARQGTEESAAQGKDELQQISEELHAGGGIAPAERLLYIRDKRGQSVPLQANAAQREFERRRGRHNIVLKARQMGMTTWVAGRFFLRTISMPGTLTLQVAHTREAAESIFRTVQRMWERLPEEMRRGQLRRSRANVGQMVFPAIDSEFRISSACDPGAGRGLSVQNLHCSEVGHWPGNAAETLAGLRAGLSPEGEMVLESTPNGAYGPFYQEWLAGVDTPERPASRVLDQQGLGLTRHLDPGVWALDADVGVVRHFLPWWLEPAYVGRAVGPEVMSEEERLLVERHGLTPRQIGYRRELERRYGVLRSQEFAEDAETCFRATGSCCFELEAVDRRLPLVNEPVQVRRNGALLVWLRPEATRQYVIGVDSSGGGATGDFGAVQVVDRKTGIQCAELQQRLTPNALAKAVAELAREYAGTTGGAMVAVERNNHGSAVLAFLDLAEGYKRVWLGSDGQAGWVTSASSKPALVTRLGTMLEQEPECFHSRRLLGECRTFVSRDNGGSGAARGAHDDLVIAMAVAQMARSRGQRVEDRE